MRQFTSRATLVSSIIGASLAMAAPASAGQHRLKNASTRLGTFYLGIPGGPHNGHVTDNLDLVVWQLSQNDQIWNVPDDNGGGQFSDFYTDFAGFSVCLGVSGGSGAGNGAPIIDQRCDSNAHPEQVWQIISSSKLGFGTVYPGCFIILNPTTGKVIGVAGGNGNVKDGGSVVQWDYDTTANQFWCEA